jgi:hypothetical protein
MLHYSAVESATLELLKNLLKIKPLENLRLVGGTCLALRIGHRKSIDLDFFGKIDLLELETGSYLRHFEEVNLLKKTSNIHVYMINAIKVDIVNYQYPWVEKVHLIDGIPLAGFPDIGAMKLAAITGRGTKKDFIDLYFLLKKYSLAELVNFYLSKYHDGSIFLVIKSLTYFEDADKEIAPEMFQKVEWSKVKESINQSVNEYQQKL